MPSLHADFAELLRVLEAEVGAPGSQVSAGGAREVAAVFLEWSLDRKKKLQQLLDVLEGAGLFEAEALASVEFPEVLAAVSEAGLTVSPRVLKPLTKLLLTCSTWGGDDDLSDLPTDRLREDLTAIAGVGAATADSILLHALGRTVFPVEKSGYRVLARHGWIDPGRATRRPRKPLRPPPTRPRPHSWLSHWAWNWWCQVLQGGSARLRALPPVPVAARPGPLGARSLRPGSGS